MLPTDANLSSGIELKMKPIRLILTDIFLLLTLSAYSQNVVDSLITAFDRQKGDRARQTAEAFFDYLAKEDFTDEPVRLLPGSKADSVKALTWYWAGEWYFDIQDYDKSILYAGKALDAGRKTMPKELECDCDNVLSIAYFRKSDYHKALEYASRARDINRAMGLEDKAAVRLAQMAAAQFSLGRYDDAERSLLEALPKLEKAGNLQSWAIGCNQMGDICLQKGDNGRAAEYFRAALDQQDVALDFQTRGHPPCRQRTERNIRVPRDSRQGGSVHRQHSRCRSRPCLLSGGLRMVVHRDRTRLARLQACTGNIPDRHRHRSDHLPVEEEKGPRSRNPTATIA